MLHIDTTPEYTPSIAGCVTCPVEINLALCHLSCLTVNIIRHLILVQSFDICCLQAFISKCITIQCTMQAQKHWPPLVGMVRNVCPMRLSGLRDENVGVSDASDSTS